MSTITIDAVCKDMREMAKEKEGYLVLPAVFTMWADAIDAHLARDGAMVPEVMKIPDYNDYYGTMEDGIPKDYGHGYAEGWNACRAAMLSAQGDEWVK